MRHMKMISKKSNDGYEVENSNKKFTFKCDEPVSAGGSGEYPRPTDYLLAALGSCLNITARSLAKRKGITIYDLTITIEADVETHGILDSKIQNGMFNINIKFDLDSDLAISKKERFLQECLTACPVHQTLENATNITWSY